MITAINIFFFNAAAAFVCLLTNDLLNLQIVEIFAVLDTRLTKERIQIARKLWVGLFIVVLPWMVIPSGVFSDEGVKMTVQTVRF